MEMSSTLQLQLDSFYNNAYALPNNDYRFISWSLICTPIINCIGQHVTMAFKVKGSHMMTTATMSSNLSSYHIHAYKI